MPVTITFEPVNQAVQLLPGENLLDCARRKGIKITSVCGARSICKSCIVQLKNKAIPAPSAEDVQFFTARKLKQGWRRACQVKPSSDCTVYIPARSRATSVRHQLDGNDFWVQPDPVVHAFRVAIPPPSLGESQADASRLLSAISDSSAQTCTSLDFAVLQSLPAALRANNWCVQAVVRFGEIIAVQPGNTRLIGLAVDIGTTNLGVFLLDLRNGTTIASVGLENPQSVFGGDVVTRVTAAVRSPDTAREMQQLVVHAVNGAVKALCNKRRLQPEHIVDVVLAGNTAMHHLFLGLPVNELGVAPFTPALVDAVDIKARELQLDVAPGAYVHVMQNIAAYVGGDHTAMLLGIRADQESRTVVALDIGTNTEISLIHRGKITSLSCPSGPALEGGHISSGMRAAEGAIESVSIVDNEICLKIIGDATASGMCGSAVVDATAAFYLAGGIAANGRIEEDYLHTREIDGQRMFALNDGEPSVFFTQEDIRAVQLAKAAIRAGIELLLETAALTHEQIDKIVIAGTFGAYINVESARAIGMVPDVQTDHFEQVGNAAGTGAKLALLSYPMRVAAQSLASGSRYFELAGSKQFTGAFIQYIGFPPKENAGD